MDKLTIASNLQNESEYAVVTKVRTTDGKARVQHHVEGTNSMRTLFIR